MIATDLLRAHPALGAAGAEDLSHRLGRGLRTAVRQERQERLACVAECERRRTLRTGRTRQPCSPMPCAPA